MKEKLDNIEEIFQKSFADFEVNVDAKVWSNIQNTINANAVNPTSPTSLTSLGSVSSKGLLLKALAGLVIAVISVTSILYLYDQQNNQENSIAKKEPATIVETIEKEKVVFLTKEKSMVEIEVNNEQQKSQVTELKSTIKTANKNNLSIPSSTYAEEESLISSDKSKINNENQPIKSKEQSKEKAIKKTIRSLNETADVAELTAKLIANTTSGNAPLDVTFSVEGNDIVSYAWDFGEDEAISNEASPYYTYTRPGNYMVKVIVLDKNNHTQTLIEKIKVEEAEILKSGIGPIPNIFSPNGDGNNDIIKIDGENIQEFHVVIMNVNGQMIFEWNNINGFWDGRDMSGNLVPEGTYYLSGYAMGKDGEKHIFKTFVNLLK